jgi:hypothetical protein
MRTATLEKSETIKQYIKVKNEINNKKKILLLKKLIVFEFLKSFLIPLINEKIKKPLNIKVKNKAKLPI